MSSNYEYKGVINKRDLRKVFLHAITMEHTWNYERMMNDGYLYSMLPALQKIYTNPEDLKEACKRHLEFFNTTPQCITLPLGITVGKNNVQMTWKTLTRLLFQVLRQLSWVL